MQNAVLIHTFEQGPVYGEKPKPTPQPGQVLVRMTARPVNPADLFSIAGVYPGFAPQVFPATPGLEGAGVVEDANSSDKVKNGQRVVAFVDAISGQGSWQEFVCIPDTSVLPIPDSVSDASAAQFVVNPVTVVGMLECLAAPAGSYIVQTAAASTLGRQFITLAKMHGLKTINIVRRQEQVAELLALGADHVLNSEQDNMDIVAEVKTITQGAMAWGAIDAVGGALTGTLTDCVRVSGTIFVYGALSGISFTGSVINAIFRDVTIKGFWLSTWLHNLSEDRRKAVFGEVLGLLSSGKLVPNSGRSFPLSQFKEAIAHASKQGREDGKVILV